MIDDEESSLSSYTDSIDACIPYHCEPGGDDRSDGDEGRRTTFHIVSVPSVLVLVPNTAEKDL